MSRQHLESNPPSSPIYLIVTVPSLGSSWYTNQGLAKYRTDTVNRVVSECSYTNSFAYWSPVLLSQQQNWGVVTEMGYPHSLNQLLSSLLQKARVALYKEERQSLGTCCVLGRSCFHTESFHFFLQSS